MREPGSLKPDYSLEFQAPELPREADYLSIQRPDSPRPFGEDLVVSKVWWRLSHPETAGFATEPRKVGTLDEVFVECDPASGPYSSKKWLKTVNHARDRGIGLHDFVVERLRIEERDEFAMAEPKDS